MLELSAWLIADGVWPGTRPLLASVACAPPGEFSNEYSNTVELAVPRTPMLMVARLLEEWVVNGDLASRTSGPCVVN